MEDRSTDPAETLRSYRRHVNQHDVTGALSHLAEDFRLEFGGGMGLSRSDMEGAMGWDVGTEGRVEWEVEREEPGAIVVRGEETNEFLRLLDVPPLPFRARFEFDDSGRILRQHHSVEWPDISIEDALAPAVDWAERHDPETLRAVYPDRELVYTESNGRRWVELLRRWRHDSGAA